MSRNCGWDGENRANQRRQQASNQLVAEQMLPADQKLSGHERAGHEKAEWDQAVQGLPVPRLGCRVCPARSVLIVVRALERLVAQHLG